MSIDDYRKQKQFVKQIAATFSLSPRTSRAGAIVYSDDAVITARFGQYQYIEDFQRAVDGFYYMGKRTRIDKALKIASDTLFTEGAGAHPDNENIMIILTGKSPRTSMINMQMNILIYKKQVTKNRNETHN